MRIGGIALGVALTAVATIASAAVAESQFPPRTVRDLIEICAPAREDPMMTAAINYCHGFAQGAVLVEEAHEAQPSGRKLFCLPSPQSAEGSEITKFIAWANALPSRLDEPAVDGMFIYLAETYPCPQEATGKRRVR
jgi:Rap1a immunity proteins